MNCFVFRVIFVILFFESLLFLLVLCWVRLRVVLNLFWIVFLFYLVCGWWLKYVVVNERIFCILIIKWVLYFFCWRVFDLLCSCWMLFLKSFKVVFLLSGGKRRFMCIKDMKVLLKLVVLFVMRKRIFLDFIILLRNIF